MFQPTVSVERTARPAKTAHLATVAPLRASVVKMVTATQDVNPSSVLAMLKLIFLPMVSVVRMERPAREALMVTAVQPRATVARKVTAMQDASPSSVLATLRPTSLPMASAARTERLARAAPTVTAARPKATVARTITVTRVARVPLVLARPTPARFLLTVDAEASTARLAREAHSATAVLLATGAVTRQLTATPAARVLSALATAQPAPSPPTASVVRTARPAREAPTVTAVQPRATVARTTTVMRVARVPLEPVTLALILSLPMETAVRTERLARVAPLETAVLSTDIVARAMISAVPDVSWPSDYAPVSQPIQSVVQGTARLVLDLALETAARQMDTVEALLLIVVRDGKFTFSMSSISLLTFFL
jgi:hypothetical protein